MAFRFPERVSGWLSYKEGRLLYRLAQKNPHLGVIVELGSFYGRSTICLAQASKKTGGGKVYAVDQFTGDAYVGRRKNYYPRFLANIKRYRLKKEVIAVRKDTVAAAKNWPKPISLLFIDAGHRYQEVAADYRAWEPYVAEGGIVAFHDSLWWPGVFRFVSRVILSGELEGVITFGDGGMGLTYGIKRSRRVKILSWPRRLQSLGQLWWLARPQLWTMIKIEFNQLDNQDWRFRLYATLARCWRWLFLTKA